MDRKSVRKLLFSIVLLVCMIDAGSAQNMGLLGIGVTTTSYTGPGNIVASATAWWGLRGYSTAVAATGTQKSVNVRRASDNATQDIVILSNGNLDMASANTFAGTDANCTGSMVGTTTLTISACSSGTLHVNDTLTAAGATGPFYITVIGTCASPPGTCTVNAVQTFASEAVTAQVAMFVTKLYDQSGNAHNGIQNTAANQPQLIPSCLSSGTLPCMQFSSPASTALVVSSTSISSIPQPLTVSSVSERTAGFTASSSIAGTYSGSGIDINYQPSATQIRMFAGSNGVFTATNSALHSLQSVFNGASSVGYLDGTSNSISTNTQATTNTFNIGQQFTSCANTSCMNGYIQEVGVWSSGFSAGNQSNMCHNQYLYWTTATSC